MLKRVQVTSLILAAVVVAVLAIVVYTGAHSDKGNSNWTTGQLASKLASGEAFHVIDVREPDEFAAGHIPGAELIPLGQLEQQISTLDKHDDIAVICRSGNRSSQAVNLLRAAGFSRVHNVVGGMLAWEGPVITGP